MASLVLAQECAKREMARSDAGCRDFVRRYFHAEWEDPIHYDLIINTKFLSFHSAASIVLNALGLPETDNDTTAIVQ